MTALRELLPPEAIASDPEGWRWDVLGGEPEAVVQPESTDEVSRILGWASRESVGVVPVGTGRHVGVRRMEGRFVVLSLGRISGIDIYEPADLTLTAGAGTPLAEVESALSPQGQWLAFDPPNFGERTLGGFVADGRTGPLWAGYGELRNHVLGATAVCGDGRVLRLGGRVVKNVAGFDLLRPLVGSRGSLAVLTSVCLRLFPVPEVDRLLVLTAASPRELVDAGRAAATAPILPASSVLLAPAQALGAEAALLLRLHGAEATVSAEQQKLEGHMGVSFETLEGERMREVTAVARDHASDLPVVVRATVLPTELAGVLALLGKVAAVAVSVDTYRGAIRIGLRADQAPLLTGFKDAVEALGGTVGVERLPGGVEAGPLASSPSPEEVELMERLTNVFDPERVLWRHR